MKNLNAKIAELESQSKQIQDEMALILRSDLNKKSLVRLSTLQEEHSRILKEKYALMSLRLKNEMNTRAKEFCKVSEKIDTFIASFS